MKVSKKILYHIFVATILVLPTVAFAQCASMGLLASGKAYDILKKIQDGLIAISATVAIIGWCVAGYLYLTSGGGERMGTAKKAMIAAVIGTALLGVSTSAKDIICSFLP